MEKQIEEMAKVIGEDIRFTITDSTDCFIKVLAVCDGLAKKLYDAGYRKQSEGEWVEENPNIRTVIAKDFMGNETYAIPDYCSNCGFRSKDIGNYCTNCGAKMKGGAE